MDASPNGDAVLNQMLDYVRRLERNSYGWRAAHLHLSKLKAQNRREFHLRIAANEFEPLLRKQRGELFQLDGGDMVYFWKGETVAEVDDVVLRLRYLFSDDPLISAAEQALEGPDEDVGEARLAKFCTWYDLERDFSLFQDDLQALTHEVEAQAGGASGPRTVAQASGKPLDPATLARLEQSLVRSDLSSLMRRQSIEPPPPLAG